MDVDEKVEINNAQMDLNIENQTNLKITTSEQENNITKSELEPCAIEENMKQSIEQSIKQKEPLQILSNELVISGKIIDNASPGTELKNKEYIGDDVNETNTSEESDVILRIGNLQEKNEFKQILEANYDLEDNIQETQELEEENMEAECIESSVVDVNMEPQIEVETASQFDEKTEDFSIKSSAILSGIENIQSSVDQEKATTLNTESIASKVSSQPCSGLSLLAQYDSDNDDDDETSDTDSVIEVPPTSAKDYRNQVVEINSDSDSDDTDSDSDVEYLNEIRKAIEKRTEVVDEDDEDEDYDNGGVKKKHNPKLKVKGEMLLEDLPPIQDLQITVPEDECIELGKIHSIIDQLVLVSVLPNAILLDLETVIFLEKGQKVLGEVFDVLGQVADPLYCVRFNSNKQIKEKDIKVGDVVYVAPKTQYTQYVILSSLMKLKGSDASWENDIEPPPRFLDYSDDEQEQVARRQLRNKDRPVDNDDPHKRPRTSEEGDQSENRSYTPKNRNRYTQQRDEDNSGKGDYNSYQRPRYNPHTNQRQQQPQQTQQPNYHRSSWHSNYYPQQYHQAPPSQNYRYNPNNRGQSQQNQSVPPHQSYPSQVPMYAMPPPMHTMPPYAPPPNYGPQASAPHMAPHPLMPNSFTIRPPTLHPQQQFTSPPPPRGGQ